MHYIFTVRSHYMLKLMGCCTFISLVSHVYMSAAYSEQYIILFHITMRDILQNKLIAVLLGLLCTVIPYIK